MYTIITLAKVNGKMKYKREMVNQIKKLLCTDQLMLILPFLEFGITIIKVTCRLRILLLQKIQNEKN